MSRHHWKTSMLLKNRENSRSCSETGILDIASSWAMCLCIWMVLDPEWQRPQTWNGVEKSCRLASSAASTPNMRPRNMRCPELLFLVEIDHLFFQNVIFISVLTKCVNQGGIREQAHCKTLGLTTRWSQQVYILLFFYSTIFYYVPPK